MQSILVSSCLLGHPVRYHGRAASCDHPVLARWRAEGRIVAVCPEVAGGLPTPRPPAEIGMGLGGAMVLREQARVIERDGGDVTTEFVRGARQALAIAQARGIRVAILKEGSPSCGTAYTYDGTFGGGRIALPGVTSACLQQAGIHVFSEAQLEEAAAYLEKIDGSC